jgi:hypothetical protein
MLLADDLVERAGAEAIGEGAADGVLGLRCGFVGGEEIGLGN